MKNSVSEYPYPLNLYRDLCSKMGKPLPDEITADQLKGMNVLIGQMPNERYRVILFERYLYGKTYDEIAKLYGFSSSRAGQILQTIIKKLTENPISELLFGFDEFLATSTIDVLNLSTRAYRALLRKDINTLEDMKYYGLSRVKTDLWAVGTDTAKEIVEKSSFIWDEEELEQAMAIDSEKLTLRQKKNLRIALEKQGLKKGTINKIIGFVETNNPEMAEEK